MPCEKRNALDLADRRDLAPRRRSRAATLLREIARPAFVRTSRSRSGSRSSSSKTCSAPKCVDDRAREGRADAGDAARQPELDPLRRLRQRRAERRDDELPAVPRVLGERAGADELLARRDVAERPGQRERLAVALLAEHGAPDRELRVVGDVARPRRRERDPDLGRGQIARKLVAVGRPHGADDTHGGTRSPGARSAVT